MKLNYWAPHVTVAAIIEKEGKFLLVEETIKNKKVINQPAGHLDPNESLVEAVIRETLEETRWEFKPGYLSGLYRWKHENDETYLRFCFVGSLVKEHLDKTLDTEIDEVIWLTLDEIKQHPRLRSPLVLKGIEDYKSGINIPLSFIQDIN